MNQTFHPGSGEAVHAPEHANPYYGNAHARPDPDLDAAAPQLRSAEEQRLNRKALMFLGGILALVMTMGFLVMRKTDTGAEAPRKGVEAARVSTPELPVASVPPPLPPAEPIPMLPTAQAGRDATPPVTPLFSTGPTAEPVADRGPSLVDRRIGSEGTAGQDEADGGLGMREYTQTMLAAMQAGNQPAAPQRTQRGPELEDASSAAFIRSPDALLVRGTYLRCVLETRIITDFAGFTSCLLTEPVYSINGRTLLLPKGSKIYGAYGGGPVGERVEVIWDRITTPNGLDVAMSSPGVDGLGGAGLPGDYSAHWGSRIASALMISLIADAFKYAAAENGPESTTVTGGGLAVRSPYESATARSMERLANDALAQRRPPTVTINQGEIINVYVARDVDFSEVLARRR